MNDSKISCRGVWKLFGKDPEEFLRKHGNAPGIDAIRQGNYIPAVCNVDLDVAAGEILIVMGLSGSGKSTLVRCLSRLIEPTAGEIFFDGKDLLKASDAEMIALRRHKMGMVFQHFALLPHRTVLNNIAFPLEVQGVDRTTREARAREVIDLVGLSGREEYFPRELSGGQQQRVGIGRSLAVEPEVWFLDEPFSALDPLIRKEMQDEFLRLQKMLHKTIVFITHDFDEAIRLADRIAIMKDGIVEQIGTAEEIVSDPATPYVEEFTKDIARDKILSASAIMTDMPGDLSDAELSDQVVQAGARLDTFAAIALASGKPVRVVNDTGATIGAIGRDTMIKALYAQAD